jgi:tetratricopeptide (TPR) repeat protein
MAGAVRVLDGDLDGAAAAYSEAASVLVEIGSRDDEAHMQMQLANIAARRGDFAEARQFFQRALAAAGSDVSGMDVAVVSAAAAMFEVTAGDVALGRSMHAVAEQGVAQLTSTHPARHHMMAVVAASGLMVALADEDLPRAKERAASMYQDAVASEDMPLLASVSAALAYLAQALGQPGRAAEILGASAAVRGVADATDLTVTLLGPRLREILGPDGYDRAYDAGNALDRAEAIRRLDPATL